MLTSVRLILNLLTLSGLLTAVVFRWEVDAVKLERSVQSSILLVRPETVRLYLHSVTELVLNGQGSLKEAMIGDVQFVNLAIQQDLINVVTKDVEVTGSSS